MIVEVKSKVITVKEYEPTEYAQLRALILSYDTVYPFYQSISDNGKEVILFSLGGYIKDPPFSEFDTMMWEVYNLDKVIEKENE